MPDETSRPVAEQPGRARAGDGISVSYFDLGGSGPPLLLAHATGFHGRVWRPLAQELAGSFRCITFDHRGHGDTTAPPDGNVHWAGFARDALAVLDAAGLERPLGLGHSAGATALLLAEISRPGAFRALYCYEPVVIPPSVTSPAPSLAAAARRRRETFPSRQAAFDNFSSKPPLDVLDPAVLLAYVEHGFDDQEDGTIRLRCRSEFEARSYEMGATHDAWERLPEITCPVIVACGGLSGTFGSEVTAMQVARLPRGRLEVFPSLGHFGPLQDPPAVAGAARRALLEPE